MNFRAVLVLPKTAGSAQAHKSMSFIWIVWNTLYVFLCPPPENSMIRIAKVIMLIFRISATELHVFPNWLILYLLQIILPMLGMTSIAMKIMVSHGKKLTREFISPSLLCVFSLPGRALPGITSGPKVRQIFKCPDSGLPFFFLPGLRTL